MDTLILDNITYQFVAHSQFDDLPDMQMVEESFPDENGWVITYWTDETGEENHFTVDHVVGTTDYTTHPVLGEDFKLLNATKEWLEKQGDEFKFTGDTIIGIAEHSTKYSLDDRMIQVFQLIERNYNITRIEHDCFEAYGAVGNLYKATKKS